MKKYIGLATGLIVAGILAVLIVIAIGATHEPTWRGKNIADEAIKVLEDYKHFRINATEAKQKIGYLCDRVDSEYELDMPEKEKDAMLMLAIELSLTESHFILHRVPTNMEIDEDITAIKKVKP